MLLYHTPIPHIVPLDVVQVDVKNRFLRVDDRYAVAKFL